MVPRAGGQATVRLTPAALSVEVADQLKKLAGLRDQGILSDSEFEMQKQEVLRSS